MDFRHCDCFGEAGLRAVEAGSVRLVLADLPYGATVNEWDRKLDAAAFFGHLDRICAPEAVVVMFSQGRFTAELMTGPWAKHFRYTLVWSKNKPRGFLNAKKQPLRYHEDILVFSRRQGTYNPQMVETGKRIPAYKRQRTGTSYGDTKDPFHQRAGKTDRYPSSILTFPVINAEEKPIHPTQKPLPLVEYLIRTYSNEGDLVLDPCAGSGTTAVACMTTSRRFVGFERDGGYYDLARKRLDAFEPVQPEVPSVQADE